MDYKKESLFADKRVVLAACMLLVYGTGILNESVRLSRAAGVSVRKLLLSQKLWLHLPCCATAYQPRTNNISILVMDQLHTE